MTKLPTKSELKEILNCPEKLIIWCGSGISLLRPSSLPLGKELVDFFMEKCVNKNFVDKLYRKWNKANIILSENGYKNIGSCPRLESVISEIQLVEEHLEDGHQYEMNFNSAFLKLDEAPFNIIHSYIANYVKNGATIVTTNYDLCIEKALNKLDPEHKFYLCNCKDGVYQYSSSKKNRGKIYHIHGVANEPKNIGISYNTVSRDFPPFFKRKLDEWLENDYNFIFLGYSCSDNYDVTRYLENLAQRHINTQARALFVQHGSLYSQTKLSQNIFDVLKCFREQWAITEDTKEFLEICLDKSEQKSLCSLIDCDVFDWKDEFSKKINISNNVKHVILLRLCCLFGINPEIFSKLTYSQIIDKYCNDNAPINKILISNIKLHLFKEQNDVQKCEELVLKNINSIDLRKIDQNKFFSTQQQYNINHVLDMQGNNSKLLDNLPPLYWIKEQIQKRSVGEGNRIGWEISTPLHQYCKLLLRNWLINLSDDKEKNDIFTKEEIRLQIECLDRIIELPFNCLEHVDQLAVALRCRAILYSYQFGMREEKHIKDDLNRAIDLYSKESSLDGICQCIILFSFVEMLFFLQSKNYLHLFKAQESLICSEKLSNVFNNQKLKSRVLDVENWENRIYKKYYFNER